MTVCVLLCSMEMRVLARTESPCASTQTNPHVAASETIAILSLNNTSRLTEPIVGPASRCSRCRPGVFSSDRELREEKLAKKSALSLWTTSRRVPRELHSSESHGASRCDAYLLRAEFSDYSNCNPIVRLQRNHFQCVGRRRESSFADRLARQCVCVRVCNEKASL